ncbi:integrase, partial [Streptomyces sp. NPDC002784]
PLRQELKLLAWLTINTSLPARFLAERSVSWRARLSGSVISTSLGQWRQLARWLTTRGITALADCTTEILVDYSRHLRQGRDRNSVHKHLTAVSRLWAFDQDSPAPTGMAEPPWLRGGIDDYLPPATSAGENLTEPITPAVMGPLLIWALRTVEEFAEDIITAVTEHRRMSATAATTPTNPAGLDALHAFLNHITAEQLPFPATRQDGTAAISYIAARTGASRSQVASMVGRQGWGPYIRRHPGPCPLDTSITGLIDGHPWRQAIDFTEAPVLMRHLGTACFIVIAYLTGMRPGEVLGLRSGCCPEPADGKHLIYGNVYKTALDSHGSHLSQGVPREAPWVAIPPVARAIRVLEHIVPDGALLFDSATHCDGRVGRFSTGSLGLKTMRGRIEDFVAFANGTATTLGRQAEAIPPDPYGSVGTARFRRTLAWHIARRPGGLVALAIQYGHLRTAMSGAYASRSRDGIHDLLDVESARATLDTLTALQDDLAHGGGISGPAARRAIQAATFTGQIITARQARDILGNPHLTVYDNPNALLMCVYKPDTALCHRTPAQAAPRLDRCMPACANIARTDNHARQLLDKAQQLEQRVAYLPAPLAERLRSTASKLRQHAARHHQRITAQDGGAL